jgi:hypothetical protein
MRRTRAPHFSLHAAGLACAMLCLLAAGCDGGKQRRQAPSSRPPIESPTATPEPQPDRDRLEVVKFAEFGYDPALFNDMFLARPIAALPNDTYAMLVPAIAEADGKRKGRIELRIRKQGETRTLGELDGDSYMLRASPSGSRLAWLSWIKEAEKNVCVLYRMPVSGGDGQKTAAFPPGVVITDYVFAAEDVVFAIGVYDDEIRDVRLFSVDCSSGEIRETLATGSFPFLLERTVIPFAPRLCISRVTGIGYFNAIGCIFAFQLAEGRGGLFLDGDGLFVLASPEVSDDGTRLLFYAVPVGSNFAASCEADVATGSCVVYPDRELRSVDIQADLLASRHSFYMNGEFPTDIVSTGQGVIAVEDSRKRGRVVLKTESRMFGALRGADNEILVVTDESYVSYRLSRLRFDSSFEPKFWEAPVTQTGRYPDFSTPETTMRTFLASFQRGDPNVWSVVQRDTMPSRWIAAVDKGVAARSLRLMGSLRGYTRFKTVVAGEETTVLEGTLETCGRVGGADVFTLQRVGSMWLIEKITAAEDLK